MREWLKRAVLKTAVPETVPGVRIPLPPPHSLGCRETEAPFAAKYPQNARISQYFVRKADWRERDYAGSNGIDLPAFLWTAFAQSGFSDLSERMQRDHKPMMWRN
jgi:hypothetical protein